MIPPRLVPLGLALLLAPAPIALLAQADPMSGQPSPSQTSRQQQQPGAASGMHDPSTQDASSGPGQTADMMRDKIFLRKASEGGYAEVQFGQLAAQKGASEDVKAFGQKMVTDHTSLNQQLQPFAQAAGVPTPRKLAGKDQAEFDKLSALSGDDFDKTYLAFMVKDHHQDLRDFRKEAESTSDASLREAVDTGEKMIHEHMRVVDAMARSRGVGLPGRANPSAGPTSATTP